MKNKTNNSFVSTRQIWITGLTMLALGVTIFIVSQIILNSVNNAPVSQATSASQNSVATSILLPTITSTPIEIFPTSSPTQQPYLLTSTPDPFCEPSQHVILAYQDNLVVIIKNISTKALAIRISWDREDPFGNGDGLDSHLEPYLIPSQILSQDIKNHVTAEIWAWDTVTQKCIDQASLIITR